MGSIAKDQSNAIRKLLGILLLVKKTTVSGKLMKLHVWHQLIAGMMLVEQHV